MFFLNKIYNIEFTEDEINTMNEIFKISIKKFNKFKKKGVNYRVSKKSDYFFSVVNKFYNCN